MITAVTIIAFLTGLLSIAAGAAKVALVPDEVAFLGQFGFGSPPIIAYGVVQFLGGLLMLITKVRIIGSVVAGVAFAFSAVLLTVAGNITFAAVSLVPVGLAMLVAYTSFLQRSTDDADED